MDKIVVVSDTFEKLPESEMVVHFLLSEDVENDNYQGEISFTELVVSLRKLFRKFDNTFTESGSKWCNNVAVIGENTHCEFGLYHDRLLATLSIAPSRFVGKNWISEAKKWIVENTKDMLREIEGANLIQPRVRLIKSFSNGDRAIEIL